MDHIIPRQHRGSDDPENLAYACLHCNRHKGPNLAGIDPETGLLTRLFHPRLDAWTSHFRWDGPEIIGISTIGRVTVNGLFMNDPQVVWLRSTLAGELRT